MKAPLFTERAPEHFTTHRTRTPGPLADALGVEAMEAAAGCCGPFVRVDLQADGAGLVFRCWHSSEHRVHDFGCCSDHYSQWDELVRIVSIWSLLDENHEIIQCHELSDQINADPTLVWSVYESGSKL